VNLLPWRVLSGFTGQRREILDLRNLLAMRASVDGASNNQTPLRYQLHMSCRIVLISRPWDVPGLCAQARNH